MSDNLTPAQLDEIEAVADAATPGPWEVIPATFEEGRRIKTPAYELMAVDIDAPYLDRTDAEHIAMMDPATTLALIVEVRELRAKVERVREIVVSTQRSAVAQLALVDEALGEEA